MKNIIIILIFCMATCSCQSQMEKQYIEDYRNHIILELPELSTWKSGRLITVYHVKPSDYIAFKESGEEKHLIDAAIWDMIVMTQSLEMGDTYTKYMAELKIELKEILPEELYEARYK